MKIDRGAIVSTIVTASLIFGLTTGEAVAQISHEKMQLPPTARFQSIEQPLWLKGVVIIGGLGLIWLDLWWFLFSKPKLRPAKTAREIREVTNDDLK